MYLLVLYLVSFTIPLFEDLFDISSLHFHLKKCIGRVRRYWKRDELYIFICNFVNRTSHQVAIVQLLLHTEQTQANILQYSGNNVLKKWGKIILFSNPLTYFLKLLQNDSKTVKLGSLALHKISPTFYMTCVYFTSQTCHIRPYISNDSFIDSFWYTQKLIPVVY